MRAAHFCLFAIASLAIFLSCSKSPGNESASPTSIDAKVKTEIQWFEGSVEEAFAKSKADNKPLLLYWGAVWCPPCNQLKYTLFTQPDFIEKTSLFVPVYLDGDTSRAQIYGDKFGVIGYPSLVVFNPEGEELTRIPGAMNIDRYAEVLDLVLAQHRPVKALVAQLQSSADSLTNDDYKILAYYSWSQDHQRALAEGQESSLLKIAFEQCPSSMPAEKSRLFVDYFHMRLAELSAEEDDADEPTLPDDFRAMALLEFLAILSDKQLTLENVYAIRYEDGSSIEAITDSGSPERNALVAAWLEALSYIETIESLSEMERLGALYAKVSIAYLQFGEEIDDALQAEIKSKIQIARTKVKNGYEHSALINMVRNILIHANMFEFADKVISEELANADSPYYFMLELAELDKEAGRFDDAMKWLQRAYEESDAGATKFQWGVNYLSGLLEMFPDNEEAIVALADELRGVLVQAEDAFYNRNASRLSRLQSEFQQWNEDGNHSDSYQKVVNGFSSLCAELNEGSDALQQCNSFVAGF